MRYVGFSEYYHDAALSIINEDGTVEFASHSERYSKKKNDPLIPENLWDLVRDDDHLSFHEDVEYMKKHRKDLRLKKNGGSHHKNSARAHAEIPLWNTLVYDEYHEHHQSHCASAFYTRPWESKEDTVMVSIDGVGDRLVVM
jgi:predicted NodU family carbamoyl transferase